MAGQILGPDLHLTFFSKKTLKVEFAGYDKNSNVATELVGMCLMKEDPYTAGEYEKHKNTEGCLWSRSYRHLANGRIGFGHSLTVGYNHKPREYWKLSYTCPENYVWQLLPPHTGLTNFDIFISSKQKKPVVILGLQHENADCECSNGREEVDPDDSDNSPTDLDFYDYENLLKFKIADEKPFYDYII